MTTRTAPTPSARDRPGGRGSWPLAGLAGLVAAGLALGVAQLVAAIVGGGSPALALGSAVVDLTPGWLKDAVVGAVGTQDKTVLFVVLALVVAGLAAGAGLAELARPAAGSTLVAVLGAVTVVAAVTRAGAGALQAAPTVVGFGVGAVVLQALVRRLRPGWVDRSGEVAPAGAARRAFLAGSGAAAALALAGVAAGHVLSAGARTASAARTALRLPRPATAAPPPPDGVQPALRGLTPYLPPSRDFYRIDTALSVPHLDPTTWSLRVHGMVDREVRVSYADLLAEDLVQARVTLSCVSNEIGGDLVGNATWLGVPLARVLARAAPGAGADMVLSTSSDGFTAATPLDVLLDPAGGALLAVGMNGAPLPFEHGFPVRMVVPGLYGYVSATKWLTDLRVTRYADATSYWSQRGWSEKAPVKTSSRIDVPADGARLSAGQVTLGGVAWAPTRGVSAVEVRVDDGPWRAATLAADGGIDTWRLWTLAWDAPAGDHRLTVRATDGRGDRQTSVQAPPAPDGATGWHQVSVKVA